MSSMSIWSLAVVAGVAGGIQVHEPPVSNTEHREISGEEFERLKKLPGFTVNGPRAVYQYEYVVRRCPLPGDLALIADQVHRYSPEDLVEAITYYFAN